MAGPSMACTAAPAAAADGVCVLQAMRLPVLLLQRVPAGCGGLRRLLRGSVEPGMHWKANRSHVRG
eukprot:1161269-Pelagomonas_calceolata.AAC.2